MKSSLASVKALLEKGANPNQYGLANDLTPLYIAVGKNDLDITQKLVKAGADVGSKDCYRHGPLYWAKDAEIAWTLIKANVDAEELRLDQEKSLNLISIIMNDP